MVGLAPARLAFVVDAVAERQQAEALEPRGRAVKAGHRLREPAERARREAAEDDPRLPAFAQDLVDPVRFPDAEQADHAAAADVDQVLREQVAADVGRPLLAAEERDVAGLATGRARRRGRSGRCNGRRRLRPRAGSTPGAAPPWSGRARSRRASGLPDSIENPPPPNATICRGAVFTYRILAPEPVPVLIQSSELGTAPLAPVYRRFLGGS